MNFVIEKEILLNKIRIVEKITAQRGNQPILSNVLIETISSNEIKIYSTDNDMSIETKAIASVKKEGKITLPAKKLFEIISKMPEKPICFDLDEEKNIMKISCSNIKFELLGIDATEFPQVENIEEKENMIVVETTPFLKAVKGTAYAAANYENRNIISGVFTLLENDKLEMAATDGNRLTKVVQPIENKANVSQKMVIPSKTLQEILRILSIENDNEIKMCIENIKIYIKIKDTILISKLLEGEYPPYQQLIPKTCEKEAIINREEMISSIERISTMVDERKNFVKFIFNENNLNMFADTPESGKAEENIDIEYSSEEQIIAFNYKYVLEALKNIESEKIKIKMNGSLSATIFEPEGNDNYLCLIMPIQIR